MVSDTKKYQVTIPKQIRVGLGIKAGAEVVFLKTEDGQSITRAKDVIKGGIEIFQDVDVTVKETKEDLGKGFEWICKGLYGWQFSGNANS